MCSTAPGPTPTSGPAGAIIRSCRSPCRSRRCPGRRLLVRPGPDARGRRGACWPRPPSSSSSAATCRAAHHLRQRGRMERLGARGFLQRTDQQFHWSNAGYATFDDFLASLASRKRKAVRKERARGASTTASPSNGCAAATSRRRTGTRSSPSTWTRARASGAGPISTASSFSLIGAATGDSCLLMHGHAGQHAIAGALHMIGGDCLYGRYWGAVEHHPCLHFELCYYQAIEFAIAAQACARRGGRPGRAQAGARLSADQDLLGALHRRSGAAPRDRRLSRARARLRGCGGRGARRIRAVPQGGAGSGLTLQLRARGSRPDPSDSCLTLTKFSAQPASSATSSAQAISLSRRSVRRAASRPLDALRLGAKAACACNADDTTTLPLCFCAASHAHSCCRLNTVGDLTMRLRGN